MTEILDFIVITLLVIAIVYGFMLNKKINLIHESKKELANLFKSFDNTILKAQNSVKDLKLASKDVQSELQKKIDKALLLADDLQFLSEKSIEAARRFEKMIMASEPANDVRDSKTIDMYSPEHIRNLKENSRRRAEEKRVKQNNPIDNFDNSKKSKKVRALENLLENISANNNQGKNERSRAGFSRNAKPQKSDKSQDELVAEALKSLGYGE